MDIRSAGFKVLALMILIEIDASIMISFIMVVIVAQVML